MWPTIYKFYLYTSNWEIVVGTLKSHNSTSRRFTYYALRLRRVENNIIISDKVIKNIMQNSHRPYRRRK